jgi:topoisomerase IV subunit B
MSGNRSNGGLHGVGVSVVNALSCDTVVEVARGKRLFRQSFARGLPTSDLTDLVDSGDRYLPVAHLSPVARISGPAVSGRCGSRHAINRNH